MLLRIRMRALRLSSCRRTHLPLDPCPSRPSRSFLSSTAFLRTNATPDPESSPVQTVTSTNVPPSLLGQLEERGLVESVTGLPGSLDTFLRTNKITAYAGVDPTARSLHVGHLLPLMNLLHFYLNGHNSIALVGKATAAVGDPSGRTSERSQSSLDGTTSNFTSIWAQLELFFSRAEEYALSRGYNTETFGTRVIRTNGEWLGDLGLVEFLSTVGRVVRVNQMLARQSVKTRMASQKGINFAEFTYQLLQSFDFWHLYKHADCRLQIGGNDQYGNITAGIDLIQRLSSPTAEDVDTLSSSETPPTTTTSSSPEAPAYGLTVPLLTTPTGEKLGKSAGNAIWLDATLTSPFELYQYFLRLPDASLPPLLRSLTLLPLADISAILSSHARNPELRAAQRRLAMEVVHLVHGKAAATKSRVMTELLFPSPASEEEKTALTAREIVAAFEGDKRLVKLPRTEVLGDFVAKVAAKAGAVKTRSEAEALVRQGGLYVIGGGNDGAGVGVGAPRKVERGEKVDEGMLMGGEVLLVRVGKGGVNIIKLVD